jgi:uncharacterized protein (DUF433 family)
VARRYIGPTKSLDRGFLSERIGGRVLREASRVNIKTLIEIDPEKLSGTPVFRGSRVPISNLFDCLEDGETVDDFLDQFPTVTREQVLSVLELSKERLLAESEIAA